MKKFKLLCTLLIVGLLFLSFDVLASTKTYTRTEDDYLVPDRIQVTSSNEWDVLNTPAVDASEKVYDFAELLSDSEEEKLYEQIRTFISDTDLDLAIVTIEENIKGSARAYSQDFYDYNDFSYNGIIFLIDMDTREIYMTTTGTAISLFPDARVDLILDSIYQKVSNQEYYEACSSFINSVNSFVKMGNTGTKEDVVISSDGTVKKNLHLWEITLFASIGTLIIILILVFTNRMVHKAASSREFLNKETMKIVNISEMFLGSHVSKVPISNSSSGSSVGGSSISRGSSGISHGGGGHKF